MKKHKLLFTILFALTSNLILAQSSEIIRRYIETYKDVAIAEEIRTGVPASITLAQGIHETGAGTSQLVLKSNNHFGIKCKTGWTGESVSHDDDAKGECFRKYNDPLESYKDHSDFLKNRPYYTSLFDLDPTDYKAWAHGLKKAGYATNPKYAQILIKLIEDYDLQQYTLLALNGKFSGNSDVAYASNVKTESSGEAKIAEPVVQKAVVKTYNFPSGVFKINETNVVFVKKGTAFLKIAHDNDLSLSKLFEFNDMKPVDIAESDQLMYLQRKRKIGTEDFHVVQEGETLHDIAQVQGIRMESLLEYNLLKQGMQPAVGEKLNLKWRVSQMPRLLATR
ncbi:MAG TPA: glucosaminidase domain-containing protein [Flavisolibacter sp.]|nr:glucosaminidase domain-containing protein [Flavisolibacter sp.]